MLGVAIVLPLLAFDFFTIWRGYQAEHKRSLEAAERLAMQLDSVITAHIQKELALLEGLAASSSLARRDFSTFYHEAKSLTLGTDRVILLRGLDTRQFVNTQIDLGSTLPSSIELTDKERNQYRENKPILSPVYSSPVFGDTRFAVALPLPQHEMILGITLPTSHIRDVIKPLLPSGWIATVGDQRGTMLARSEKHEEITGKPANQRYLESAGSDQGSFEVTNFEGIQLISGYRKSPFSSWLIAANVPRDLISEPYRRHFISLIFFALASLGLSIVAAYTLGRFFAHDTSRLESQATSIAQNRRVRPAHIRLTDLAKVGDALVKASESLHARERERALLTNELNHRVKNTLASIQSIAYQSIRDGITPQESRKAITERLTALSKAHDILTRSNWHSAGLIEVISLVVKGFGGSDRILVHRGPDLRLRSSAALALSLALHELATNATKYGALSVESGTVEIAWQRFVGNKDGGVEMAWRELGGPPTSPPAKQGFGTRLIQGSFADYDNASTKIDFNPSGVICTIRIPESALSEDVVR